MQEELPCVSGTGNGFHTSGCDISLGSLAVAWTGSLELLPGLHQRRGGCCLAWTQ